MVRFERTSLLNARQIQTRRKPSTQRLWTFVSKQTPSASGELSCLIVLVGASAAMRLGDNDDEGNLFSVCFADYDFV